MQTFNASPLAFLRSLALNWQLLCDLARRDAIGRYRGSWLGIFWSLLTPLVMLSIYTVVFSEVFKAKWSAQPSSKVEFAIVLFAGIIVFNFFAECINRAPGLIVSNVNFVKKVIFPLEILPCVGVLSALFHLLVSVAILIVFMTVEHWTIPLTALFLPMVLLPLLFFVLGASWILAATSVFIRDIAQTVGLVTSGLMFLSPVFFPLSALPEKWRAIAHINPLVYPIEEFRNVLVWGKGIEWNLWGPYFAFSIAFASFGFAWFQKTRKGFADVL